LRGRSPPPVIFVTAYDEYAIRAFEVNALDYLLKPFSRRWLEKAVRRAQEALSEEQSFATRLGPLLESLAAQGRYMTRLAVRDYENVRWFKGSHKLRLTTGAEVGLSRAQARVLRKILGW